MSRPFSYNDENFTVIGNILFVHFADSEKHSVNDPVLEVPYEIFRRLKSFSNIAVVSSPMVISSSSTVPIAIRISNKPFIVFLNDRPKYNHEKYYYCFYLLKDI